MLLSGRNGNEAEIGSPRGVQRGGGTRRRKSSRPGKRHVRRHRSRRWPKTRRARAEGVGLRGALEVAGKREQPDLVHRIFLNPEDQEKPLNGFQQKSGI